MEKGKKCRTPSNLIHGIWVYMADVCRCCTCIWSKRVPNPTLHLISMIHINSQDSHPMAGSCRPMAVFLFLFAKLPAKKPSRATKKWRCTCEHLLGFFATVWENICAQAAALSKAWRWSEAGTQIDWQNRTSDQWWLNWNVQPQQNSTWQLAARATLKGLDVAGHCYLKSI